MTRLTKMLRHWSRWVLKTSVRRPRFTSIWWSFYNSQRFDCCCSINWVEILSPKDTMQLFHTTSQKQDRTVWPPVWRCVHEVMFCARHVACNVARIIKRLQRRMNNRIVCLRLKSRREGDFWGREWVEEIESDVTGIITCYHRPVSNHGEQMRINSSRSSQQEVFHSYKPCCLNTTRWDTKNLLYSWGFNPATQRSILLCTGIVEVKRWIHVFYLWWDSCVI